MAPAEDTKRLTKIEIAKELVQNLLISDPFHRATVYSALASQWILSELEELQELYYSRVIDMS